jgi:molybdopterin molybdotransferase
MTPKHTQRIDRLTPLAEAVRKLKAMAGPVAPIELAIDECPGLILADDLVSLRASPPDAVALRDGWAVRADALVGAGPYAPLPLDPPPPWVNAGDKLPAGADSVAPLETIAFAGQTAQAVAQVFPGEGVLPPGEFVREGVVLRAKGARLRATDIAAAKLAGVARAKVRKPQIALLQGGARDISPSLEFLARAIAEQGGNAEIAGAALDKFLASKLEADAVIAVGGTGSGRNDDAVSTLASHGEVELHGIAIAPGETLALGQTQDKPVLLVPGRFDAALAAWLLVGRELVTVLAASTEREMTTPVALARKISSAPGLAEVVPVRCEGSKAAPLASGVLSLEALAGAQGWVLVPPGSEGFAEGAVVDLRRLP